MASSFGRKKHPLYRDIIIVVAVFAALAVIFSVSVNAVSAGDAERQQESLESALEQDITYCYATKGRYPSSLEEICSDYGLTYNEDLFMVDYQVRGANIRPDVTILKRTDRGKS